MLVADKLFDNKYHMIYSVYECDVMNMKMNNEI